MHSYLHVRFSIVNGNQSSQQGEDIVYPEDEIYAELMKDSNAEEPLPGQSISVKIDENSTLKITVLSHPQVSNCCGAHLIYEDICSDCKEHCEPVDENE